MSLYNILFGNTSEVFFILQEDKMKNIDLQLKSLKQGRDILEKVTRSYKKPCATTTCQVRHQKMWPHSVQ